MKSVAVLISGMLPLRMIDCFVSIAPSFQTTIDVVLVSEYLAAFDDDRLYDRLDCFLYAYHNLSITLNHAKNRRLVTSGRPPSTFAL